jgi:hypothetical protein
MTIRGAVVAGQVAIKVSRTPIMLFSTRLFDHLAKADQCHLGRIDDIKTLTYHRRLVMVGG